MPDYLTMFDLDDFNLGSDQDQIGRLISLYFDTPRRYVDRNALDLEKLKEEHLLNMSHSKVLAVSKLYKEGSTTNCDDRIANFIDEKNQPILQISARCCLQSQPHWTASSVD